ncbi:MAG TPA: acyl-CoA thioesterase domain-containing protein [Pseudonocardiaceae bacterium]|nr:acyl-CoA thioesterase domain-containing protein [Pseudonocardiaceae bacterium]
MSLSVLEDLLAIKPLASGRQYTARCMIGSRHRTFGGQVAAQAFHAAALSTESARVPHSLHGSFLHSGDPDVDITYTVTTLKDGRSLTTHRVDATQPGHMIFTAVISFHVAEPSLDMQTAMPEAPPPTEFPRARYVPPGVNAATRAPFDFRFVNAAYTQDRVALSPKQLIWTRTDAAMSGDPYTHAAALVYVADLSLARTASLPLREMSPRRYGSSLDFAVWFHRSLRLDEWMLVDVESSTYSDSRALATGRFFAIDGRLVATASQEVLIRVGSEA